MNFTNLLIQLRNNEVSVIAKKYVSAEDDGAWTMFQIISNKTGEFISCDYHLDISGKDYEKYVELVQTVPCTDNEFQQFILNALCSYHNVDLTELVNMNKDELAIIDSKVEKKDWQKAYVVISPPYDYDNCFYHLPENTLKILSVRKTITSVYLLKYYSEPINTEILKAINNLPHLERVELDDYELEEDGLNTLQEIAAKPLELFAVNGIYVEGKTDKIDPHDLTGGNASMITTTNAKTVYMCGTNVPVGDILSIIKNGNHIERLVIEDYGEDDNNECDDDKLAEYHAQFAKLCHENNIKYHNNNSDSDYYNAYTLANWY